MRGREATGGERVKREEERGRRRGGTEGEGVEAETGPEDGAHESAMPASAEVDKSFSQSPVNDVTLASSKSAVFVVSETEVDTVCKCLSSSNAADACHTTGSLVAIKQAIAVTAIAVS